MPLWRIFCRALLGHVLRTYSEHAASSSSSSSRSSSHPCSVYISPFNRPLLLPVYSFPHCVPPRLPWLALSLMFLLGSRVGAPRLANALRGWRKPRHRLVTIKLKISFEVIVIYLTVMKEREAGSHFTRQGSQRGGDDDAPEACSSGRRCAVSSVRRSIDGPDPGMINGPPERTERDRSRRRSALLPACRASWQRGEVSQTRRLPLTLRRREGKAREATADGTTIFDLPPTSLPRCVPWHSQRFPDSSSAAVSGFGGVV